MKKDKLKKLSAWLNTNGFKKESSAILNLLSKQAGSCEPPFDKSHVSKVSAGGTISRGDRGPAVGYIQTLLERNGHPLDAHGVDCIFGSETMSAIKDFQRGTRIEETGEINDNTLAELEKAPKISETQPPPTPQASAPRDLTPHELDEKYKKWSAPNTGSKKTQPNFFTIAGNNNYRSGKPINKKEFFQYLKDKHGITTIIDLMNNKEGESVRGAGMTYIDVPLGSRGPKESDWQTIKSALLKGNALIHCRHGADRTGAVISRWEVELGLKTPEEALKDSLDYGFKKSDFKGYYAPDHPKYNPDPNRDLRAYILKSRKDETISGANLS
jgi:peptidoglycan hydrolase-like protein with peptidoglycan-binding domain